MATRSTLLLVEGPTDLTFVTQLLAATPATHVACERTSQHALGGVDAVKQKLLATMQSPEFQTDISKIVVLRDCDDDAAASFSQTAATFSELGLPGPEQPFELKQGVFVSPTGAHKALETAVFMVPDGASAGCLETLFLRSVADTAELACVDNLVLCWQAAGAVTPARQGARDRMRMQALLARFAAKGYVQLASSMDPKKVAPPPWDFNHQAFAPLLAHLRAL